MESEGVDFSGVIEFLNSDDIMLVYTGVVQLQDMIFGYHSQLPYNEVNKAIVRLLNKSSQDLGDFLVEIKNLGLQCICNVMNVKGESCANNLVDLDVLSAIKFTLSDSMGQADFGACLQCIETIIDISPNYVLKSGILLRVFEQAEFEIQFQDKSLRLMQMLCGCAESAEDLKQHVLPIMPTICRMLGNVVHQGPSGNEWIETISNILAATCRQVTRLHVYSDFCKIKEVFESLQASGMQQAVMNTLGMYAESLANDQQLQVSTSDNIINTDNNQVFLSSQCVSDLIMILQESCRFSSLVMCALIEQGIFRVVEKLLMGSHGQSQIVSNALGLLQSLLPEKEQLKPPAESNEETESETGPTEKVDLSLTSEQAPEQKVEEGDKVEVAEKTEESQAPAEKIEKEDAEPFELLTAELEFGKQTSAKKRETSEQKAKMHQEALHLHKQNKLEFFSQMSDEFHDFVAQSLLPKVFRVFNSEVNPNLRTLCITIIQLLFQATPHEPLMRSMDLDEFTKFTQIVLAQKTPKQVLECLSMIEELSISEFGRVLAQRFTRFGIQEQIAHFTDSVYIQQMNSGDQALALEVNLQEKLRVIGEERARQQMKIQQIKQVIEGGSLKGKKASAKEAELKNLQRNLDQLAQDYQGSMQKHEALKNKPDCGPKIGDSIAQLASRVVANLEKILKTDGATSNMFSKLKDLSTQLQSCKLRSSADLLLLCSEVSEQLTHDLTSYEFTHSQLLGALADFLTNNERSQAQEESKDDPVPHNESSNTMSVEQAVAFIKRLRQFTLSLCLKKAGKLPFKSLVQLCHEQVTLAENEIFRVPKSADQGGHGESTTMKLCYRPLEDDLKCVSSELLKRRDLLYRQLNEFTYTYPFYYSVVSLEPFLKRMMTTQDVHRSLREMMLHHGGGGNPQSEELMPLFDQLFDLMEGIIECPAEELDEVCESIKCEALAQIEEWNSEKKPTPTGLLYSRIQNEIAGEIQQREEYASLENRESDIEQRVQKVVALLNEIKDKAFRWELYSKLDMATLVADLPESEFTAIELNDDEKVSSHEHTLKKHHESFPASWNCDRISGAQVCRGRNKAPGWRCVACNFDLCNVCMHINKALDAKLGIAEAKKEEVVSVHELLKGKAAKQNQLPDVEFQFFVGDKPISKLSKLDELRQTHMVGELASQTLTVHFQIRDQTSNLVEAEGEEKSKEKPQAEAVVLPSVVAFAQDLISRFERLKTKEFKSADFVNSLKVLKALWYIRENLAMFQSANFTIFDSQVTSAQDLTLNDLQNEVTESHFVHQRLDNNFLKSLTDRSKHNTHQFRHQNSFVSLNPSVQQLVRDVPFLFSFESKIGNLRLVDMNRVDNQRANMFMALHLRRTNPNIQLPQLKKQVVVMDRSKSIVEQAIHSSTEWRKHEILDVQYKDEVGTGTGPTLEFYNLLGRALLEDKSLWRPDTEDGMLFPQAYPQDSKELAAVCEKMKIAGIAVGKSLVDDRLINLPISPLMWQLVLGDKMHLADVRKLDKSLAKGLGHLSHQLLRAKEHPEEKEKISSEIESMYLVFVNPANSSVELMPGGQQTDLTFDNAQEYIDRMVQSTFDLSLTAQLTAFTNGLKTIVPVQLLAPFSASGELETLICGQTSWNEEEWRDTEHLAEVIKAEHGFHKNSKAFRFLLRYITEIEPGTRANFMAFLTGSPRLPIGGFGALVPRLSVTLKKPDSPERSPDDVLPSVSTCQKNLKMTDYSTYEALKAKFDIAVAEGRGFALS